MARACVPVEKWKCELRSEMIRKKQKADVERDKDKENGGDGEPSSRQVLVSQPICEISFGARASKKLSA